jgi:hypothetical protein
MPLDACVEGKDVCADIVPDTFALLVKSKAPPAAVNVFDPDAPKAGAVVCAELEYKNPIK